MDDFVETCETFLQNADSKKISDYIKYFCKYNEKYLTPRILELIFASMLTKKTSAKKNNFIKKNIELLCSIQNMKIIDFLIKNTPDPNIFLKSDRALNNSLLINFLLQYDRKMDFNDFFLKKCKYVDDNDISIIKLLIEKGITNENINNGFYEALCYNKINLMKYLLEYGAKCSGNNFEEVCRLGDISIINLIIDKALDDFNGALIAASRRNCLHCIQLLIEKGATNLDKALIEACKYDGRDNCDKRGCIELLIENGATNLNDALLAACKINNHESAIFLIKRGATNLNEALLMACKNNSTTVFDILIDNGATNLNEGLTEICKIRCLKNYYGINTLIQRGATNSNEIFLNACENNFMRPIKTLIEIKVININEILEFAYLRNQTNIIKIIINAIFQLEIYFTKVMQYKFNNFENIVNFLKYAHLHDDFMQGKILPLYRNKQSKYIWFENKQMLKYILRCDSYISIKNIYHLNVKNIIALLLYDGIVSIGEQYYYMKNALLLIFYNFFSREIIEFFDSLPTNSDTVKVSQPTKIEAIESHIILYNQLQYNKLEKDFEESNSNFEESDSDEDDNKKNVSREFMQLNGMELLKDYLNNNLWRPSRHELFPDEMKDRVEIFLLCIKIFSASILRCKIPKPLLGIIINYYIIHKK